MRTLFVSVLVILLLGMAAFAEGQEFQAPPAAGNTKLFFPVITNQAGFDTGVAIVNRSVVTQKCEIQFFGQNAPATVKSMTINPGYIYSFVTSVLASNFQGYVVAVCSSREMEGTAFISDLGRTAPALGYRAFLIKAKYAEK